jgi:hypothetical protein
MVLLLSSLLAVTVQSLASLTSPAADTVQKWLQQLADTAR